MMQQKGRVEIVEGLRGIAALSVAWFHFTQGNTRFLEEGFVKASGQSGWLGVYIFFVISGFVIPYALFRANYTVKENFCRFLGRRLVRLEPPYILCILLTVLLWYISSRMPGFRGTAPEWSFSQMFFHIGYLVPFSDHPWLSPVFWSLAIEFQYYIAMGLVFPLLVSKRSVIRIVTLAAMCLLSYFVRDKSLFFAYLGLFTIGILVFQLYAKLIGTGMFLVCSSLAALVVWEVQDPPTAVAGLLTGFAIAFLGRVRLGPLVYLGTISYSLYLLHVPIGGRIINLGEHYAVNTFGRMLALTGALLLSILAAHLFYRYVEYPSRLLSMRIGYTAKTEKQVLSDRQGDEEGKNI
jgi:peptidoglycan/LPS O-acetylase OafA/YrhL